MPKTKSYALGLQGEDIAKNFLQGKGFTIITSRFKTRFGEIDCVAENDDFVVFVEVKYRPYGEKGDGFLAITPKKMQHLWLACEAYLQKHPTTKQIRIDAIEIIGEHIEHLENILYY